MFHSPHTYVLKSKHEKDYPDFPWEYAFKKWKDYDELSKNFYNECQYMEYSHTDEFSVVGSLNYIIRVSKEGSCPTLSDSAIAMNFHWSDDQKSFIKYKLVTVDTFEGIEHAHWSDFTTLYTYGRLYPTIRACWAIALIKTGYKLDDLAKLFSGKLDQQW